MGKDYTRRYNNFCKALDNLLYCRTADPNNCFILEGVSQRFNLAFDLSWKVMKDILVKEMGIMDFATGSPKATLKTAYSCGIIKDDIWLSMLNTRNELVHDYNGELVKNNLEVILDAYCDEMLLLKDTISKYCNSDHLSTSDVFQN